MSSTGLETCVRLLSSMLAHDTREVRTRTISAPKPPKAKHPVGKNICGKSARTPKGTTKKNVQRAAPARRSRCQEGEPCERQLRKNPPVNLVSESENSTSSSAPMPLNSTDAVKMTEVVSSFVKGQFEPALKQSEPDMVAAPGQAPSSATMYNQRLPSSTPNITPTEFKEGDIEQLDANQRILQLAQILQRTRVDGNTAPPVVNNQTQPRGSQKMPLQAEKDVSSAPKAPSSEHPQMMQPSSGKTLALSDLSSAQLAQYWSLLTEHNPERFQNIPPGMQTIPPPTSYQPPPYPTNSANFSTANAGGYLVGGYSAGVYSSQNPIYKNTPTNPVPVGTTTNHTNFSNGQNMESNISYVQQPTSMNPQNQTIVHPTTATKLNLNQQFPSPTSVGYSYNTNHAMVPSNGSVHQPLHYEFANTHRNFNYPPSGMSGTTTCPIVGPSTSEASQQVQDSPSKRNTQPPTSGLNSVKKVHFGIQTEEKRTWADTAIQCEDEIPSRDIDGQKNTEPVSKDISSAMNTESEDKLKDSLGSSGNQMKMSSSQWQQTDPEHVLPPGEPPLQKPYSLVAIWRLLEELRRTTQDEKEAAALVGRLETAVGQLETQWTTDMNLAVQPLRSQNAELRRRLRIAHQQLKHEMEKAAEASKPDITADLLHLGLQRRHLETQLATEHTEGERLRQEVALLQGQLENVAKEKKDLYTLIAHKENEYLKSQQERVQEAKTLRQQLHEMQEERCRMQMELRQARENVERLQDQDTPSQQTGVHQLLRGLESGLREMLKNLERSDCTPQQRAALERVLQDTSSIGKSQPGVPLKGTLPEPVSSIPRQHQRPAADTRPKPSVMDGSHPPFLQTHPVPASTGLLKTGTSSHAKPPHPYETLNETPFSPISEVSLGSTDDPDLLDEQDSTLVEEVFPANMTVQSFLSLTEYFRRYPKSNTTPDARTTNNSIHAGTTDNDETKLGTYAPPKTSSPDDVFSPKTADPMEERMPTYPLRSLTKSPEKPAQGYVYRGTQLDTSLSTIRDGESVSSGVTWSSLSSFNDEMFQQGLQKLDEHIAQLQASLKKSG